MGPHPQNSIERRFLISIALTALVLVAEVIGGYWTGSLALLSDAAHVFMDIFALGLSYIALRLSALPADDRHTYGYHRLEVLAALTNGVTLMFIAIGIFGEAWKRWQAPEPVKSMEMMAIAAVGLVANLVVAFVLGGRQPAPGEGDRAQVQEDINVKSAFLHVLGDAVSSVGVILAALLITLTGWAWLDPLVSMLIGALILVSSGRVLKGSLHILIEGVPEHVKLSEVAASISDLPGVADVHDLHIWSICSGHVALSAHIVTGNQTLAESEALMAEVKRRLSRFGIEHTTIQLESSPCQQGRANPAPAENPPENIPSETDSRDPS